MAFTEVIPLDVVTKNQLQIYQVTLSNWGNVGTGADPNSVVSPRFRIPIAGIAIDPDSQVNRAILRPSRGGVVNPSGVSLGDDIPFDSNRPLGARLSFPRIRQYDGGFGIVCPNGDRFADTLIELTGGVIPFGGATVAPNLFFGQDLRLLMFLDASLPVIQVPARTRQRFTNTQIFVSNGNPFSVFLPIPGRKRFRISARINAIGGRLEVRGIATLGLGVKMEFPLVAPFAIFGSTATDLVNDPLCEYIRILFDQIPVGGPFTLHYVLEAED